MKSTRGKRERSGTVGLNKKHEGQKQQEQDQEDAKVSSPTTKDDDGDHDHAEYILKGRNAWLFAKSQADLDSSEALYKGYLNRLNKRRVAYEEALDAAEIEEEGNPTIRHKRVLRRPSYEEALATEELRCQVETDTEEARKRVFLLVCQAGRDTEVQGRMKALGYIARLGRNVLNYKEPVLKPLGSAQEEEEPLCAAIPVAKKNRSAAPPGIPLAFLGSAKEVAITRKLMLSDADPEKHARIKKGQKDSFPGGTSSSSPSSVHGGQCPGWITDNTLPSDVLARLQAIYNPPGAPYWTTHQYQVEPPSPYYSYVFPLSEAASYGVLGEVACAVRRLASENVKSKVGGPSTFDRCRYAEVWAHNRPHASGHQLHFDSDDEGRGGIRNPVAGSIFYLSEGVGGPSLMTDQPFGSQTLASKGWLCSPKANRLLVFDGTMLHGVIPGKGFRPPTDEGDHQRRVTLMCAMWENIETRDEETWGSARPFPIIVEGGQQERSEQARKNQSNPAHTSWVEAVRAPVEKHLKSRLQDPQVQKMAAVALDHVWERLNGEAWDSEKDGIPPYDKVFQGF